ncbi:MAG: 30S ribosomal protein S4 [Chloroflexi bacterium]|nr:MAG: 30S ribosomal protein S4 [Chloroflexota bacterium]
MKYNGPKVKLSRKLGIPLTAKAARIMDKKSHPPGEHGREKQFRRKVSDYARQLLEKQRLRAQYNIHERQMRNYVDRAVRKKGVTGNTLIQILETRLDAFVHRAGLAPTIYAARQLVGHGHVQVNGRRVDLPAYELRPNDVVTIKESSRQMPLILDAVDNANPPSYIELDKANLRARLLRLPEREETPIICELPLVIEYYSR